MSNNSEKHVNSSPERHTFQSISTKEKLSKDDKDKTKTKKKDTKNDEKNKKKDMQKYTEKSKKTNGGSSACKIDVE